jgi:hypothetical protein
LVGPDAAPWATPTGLAVDEEHIWVLDRDGAIFNLEVSDGGAEIGAPTPLSGDGDRPVEPSAIAADAGTLYVLSSADGSIDEWDSGAWKQGAHHESLKGARHLSVLDGIAYATAPATKGAALVSVSLKNNSAEPTSVLIPCVGPLAAHNGNAGPEIVVLPTCTGVPDVRRPSGTSGNTTNQVPADGG